VLRKIGIGFYTKMASARLLGDGLFMQPRKVADEISVKDFLVPSMDGGLLVYVCCFGNGVSRLISRTLILR